MNVRLTTWQSALISSAEWLGSTKDSRNILWQLGRGEKEEKDSVNQDLSLRMVNYDQTQENSPKEDPHIER